MSFIDSFLPEFEHEMSGTRAILERVPDSLLDWKAHETLNSVGWVASHVVDTISWAEVILTETSFDIAPPNGPPHETPMLGSAAEMVPGFDKHLSVAKDLIGKATDADLAVPWSLLQGGETLLTMPRGSVLKTFLLNHVIHHRAFLVAYLRMNGVECPGLYG